MTEHESNTDIREIAKQLDSAVERRDLSAVVDLFSDDCEVTLFGIELTGQDAVKRAFQSVYDRLEDVRFEPITIMTDDSTLFEEFRMHATSPKGESVSIDAAEVLNFNENKIIGMRLYLDRLQLAGVIAEGILERKLLEAIERKSREGLE